ncbi:TPA: NAD-dependent epimerase/dehydratase family protein [Streptococcus suis]|nr:NAD(P)-dependent oxidoreductase [Streptococcus suis]
MKILVTGAAGYLGLGIVKKLLDDGMTVIATDFDTSQVDERAERIDADLFKVKDPYNFFGKPTKLLHLAWRDGFQHSSLAHLEDLNAHFQFLISMMENGVIDVSILGTMHEVGFFEGPIDENTICNPLSLYGISKNALRQAICIEATKYSCTIKWLRGFYIVGNTDKGASIFSKIIQASKQGETSFPFTSGKNKYDFLIYADFCSQVSATVQQSQILGIINICSGEPVSLADRVELFIEENNLNIQLEYGVFPDRAYDSKAVWGNNEKIKQIMQNYKGEYGE